jgi:endonuclease/exonuclease/phosphatase (EEP) superfamily protein YafD
MMAPEIPTGAPARVQDPVRIMSVNLLMVNRNVEPILAEIGAADPEVVLLQEYTDHWHEAWVKAHGKRYPHGGHVNREDSFGIAIWSKRPLADVRVDVPIGDGSTPQMRAVMQHAGRPIALYNVHLLPPRTFSYLAGHRMEVRNLVSLLEAEKLPAIVTGDFNFSMRTPQADRLLAAGYVDAHRSAGRGRGATWPVIGITRYVPGVQLDHVFLRGPLACARVETGEGRGSDHRPLMVELGWTP